MFLKAIILCTAAFMVQSIAGQCARPILAAPSCGCAAIQIPSSGGSLIATSVGPIRPSGIAVATDLGLAGDVVVTGALPFLSAVAFDGSFPTDGSAGVSYGCGDGCVSITQVTGGSAAGSRAGSGSYGSRCY